MPSIKENRDPIEVWLRQIRSSQITCTVYWLNETSNDYYVESQSMRGAQREITAWIVEHGYEPLGRWTTEGESGGETMRRFKRPGLERPLMNAPKFTRPLT
jgi:hypothetical protein